MKNVFLFVIIAYVCIKEINGCTINNKTFPQENNIKIYKTSKEGIRERYYDVLAGRLNQKNCQAFCGCKGHKYAGHDGEFCWCGNEEAECCIDGDHDQCLLKINASVISKAEFEIQPSKIINLFEPVVITIKNIPGLTKYGLLQNDKLQISNGNVILKIFTGYENNVIAEADAFWGCQSEAYEVIGILRPSLELSCPSEVITGTEFDCDASIFGSNILSLSFKVDGVTTSTFSDIDATEIYYIGGDMRTNRFEDYVESFDWSMQENTAFININHEFHSDGKLKGFEAYITKTGCLQFIIVRPFCFGGKQKYSNYLHSCMDNSDPINVGNDPYDYHTYYAPSDQPLFIMENMRFASANSYQAPPINVMDRPAAEYEVMFEYEVNATDLGSQTFVLPDNTIYNVKQGYVLGWVACGDNPGDIGYYHIDPIHESMFRRYRYPEVKRTFKSAFFTAEVDDRIAENFREMLQAIVLAENIYEEQVEVTFKPGSSHNIEATIELTNGSSITKNQKVYVGEPIKNLTLSKNKYEVKAGKVLSLTNAISVDQGASSMKICMNFGDGPLSEADGTCHIVTRDKKKLKHVYKTPGEYTLKVSVFNMFSKLNATATVSVRGSVTFLRWLDETTNIQPVEVNKSLSLNYLLSGAGVATIFYNVHPANITNSSTTSVLFDLLISDIVLISVSYHVTYPIDLQCTVGVNDTVNQKSITAIGIVENPISSVRVSKITVLTNQSAIFWIHPSVVGTNITFLWVWGDGTSNSTSGLHQMYMNHTYKSYGNKTITIFAWNHVSNFTSKSIINVVDPVANLKYLETPYHTRFSEVTKFYATLELGSAVKCTLFTIKNNRSADMTLTNLDTLGLLYIFAEFVYPLPDFYEVTLECSNNNTAVNITESFYVENIIEGLSLTVSQELSGGLNGYYDDIEENELLTITANTLKGENIFYVFNSGDGQIFESYENSVQLKYKKWSSNGKPYAFYVNATNHVSFAESTIDIFVERPLIPLAGFKIIAKASSSSEPVSLTLKIKTGNFFSCRWIFSGKKLKVVNYEEFLKEKGKILVKLNAGLQDVLVNCSSRLFQTTANASFYTYIPVSAFSLQAFSKCPGKDLVAGIGRRNNLYSKFCPIYFQTQEQEGTNVTNYYDLDYLDDDDNPVVGYEYPLKGFTHFFNVPREQEKPKGYLVTVTPSNLLTKEFSIKRSVRIILIVEVKPFNTSIGRPGDHLLGYATNFSITLYNRPYEVCCVLDVGIKGHKKYLYGVEACPGLPQYSENHQYIKEVEGNPIGLGDEPGKQVLLLRYKYKEEGLYKSSITCANEISSYSVVKYVKVLDLPCDPPFLKFNTPLSKDINFPKPTYLKCWKVRFAVTAAPSCLKSNTTIVYKWSLEKVRDQNNGSDYEVVNMEKVTGNLYQKQERELAYGTYRILVNATMYQAIDNVTKKEVPQTTATVIGFFRIHYCNLVPGIKGGEGKAASYKNNITVDGGVSVDPDIEPGEEMNLKFEWFCKQKEENDTVDSMRGVFVTYPDEQHPASLSHNASKKADDFKGCFGNGPGQLYGSKIIVDIGKIYLQLRYFIRNRNYTIFMRLSKTGRADDTPFIQYDLTVTSTEVPSVTIQCMKNCEQPSNPSDQIKMTALCDNCPEDISNMIFDWKMYIKNEGEPDTEYEKFTPPDGYVVAAIKNGQAIYVANAKTFPPAVEAKVKLDVKWSEKAKVSGFSLKKFTINSPPDLSKAKCLLKPLEGEALLTSFQLTCGGVTDEHTPITYKFFFELNDGPQMISYKQGKAISNKFLLPGGKVKLMMQAIDQLQADSGFLTQTCDVETTNLAEDRLSNLLMDAAKSGDAQASSNLINSLLAAAATNPTAFDEDKMRRMKSDMMNVVKQMNVNNAEDAMILVDSYLNIIGDDEGIADMEDVNTALTSLEKILAIPKDEYGPGKYRQLTEKTMKATSKITGTLTGNYSDVYLEKAKEIEYHVASTYAQEILPGEDPFTFETSSGEVYIGCEPLTEGSVAVLSIENYRINQTCVDEELSKIKVFSIDEDGFENYDSLKLACIPYLLIKGINRYKHDIEGGKNIQYGTSELTLYHDADKMLEIDKCEPRLEIHIDNIDRSSSAVTDNKTYIYNAYGEFIVSLHVIDVIYNETSIFTITKPLNTSYDGRLFVFCNKDFAPSIVKYDAKCILPNDKPDNYVNMTYEEQLFWHEEFEWRCFILQSSLNQMAKGTWLCAVLNIPIASKRPTQLLPRDTDPDDRPYPIVQYSFQGYIRACLYRKNGVWLSSKGDEPSTKTYRNKTICLTRHLDTFGGGGPFSKPEIIDFTKAFDNYSSVGTNPTIMYLVVTLAGLYLLFLIWSRRQDLKDIKKRMVCELDDNHPNDTYFYEISIQTGNISGCSTTANVFIVLYGSEGESSPRELCNPNRRCFKQNTVDSFLLSSAVHLGDVQKIQIWHNNNGGSPGWYLMHVQVQDIETRKKYQFICNEWLDVSEGDYEILRNVYVSTREDLMEFDYRFSHTATRLMSNDHIWLSIFMKSAQNSFTRVQRLTTCFTLLMATLLANTTFYFGEDRPPTDSMKLAVIYVTVPDLINGLAAALMILPLNFLLVLIFKKSAPNKKVKKEEKFADKYAEGVSTGASFTSLRGKSHSGSVAESDDSSRASPAVHIDVLTESFRKDNTTIHDQKPKYLPHWLKYIAYFMCLLICVGSGLFVVYLGYNYGKSKSDQFIVSLLLAMLITTVFIQPFIVLVLTLLTLFWWKECVQIDEVSELQRAVQKRRADNDDLIDDPLTQYTKRNSYKLPDELRLEESRNQRFKERRMKTILKEIFVHLSFVVLCLMVCYSSVDPNSQRLYESGHILMGQNAITNAYFGGKTYESGDRDAEGNDKPVSDGPSISTRAEWFDWARYSVIEYLFPIGWYNRKETNNFFKYKRGFIADAASSKVLAMARFRQLRLKHDTCIKHEVFKYLISQCNGPYSYTNQLNESFNQGWKPLNETWNKINREGKRKTIWKGLEDPWQYSSMDVLQNFPFYGRFATYDGASYAVSIGPKKRIAKKLVYAMKDYFWIDRYTRAIFTEANIYNANTNLLLLITFLHEILPTGGWNYYPNVQAIRLYRYVGGLGDLIIFFDIAFLLVTFYGLYKIIRSCKRDGIKTYVSNSWNVLHIIVTTCSLMAFLITIVRVLEVKHKIIQYKEKPEEFVSFTLISLLENLTIACLGFVLFFTNLEFLRILRFNHQIALMSKTMSILGAPLGSFGMTFFVIFMAYVSLAHCLFVDKLEDFKTVMETLVSLARMFMGQFTINDYFDNAPYLGPILFFTYMLSVQMVMINLFVGLICDAYAESGEAQINNPDNGEKPNLFNFVRDQVKSLANNGIPVVDPIYSDWKDEWEMMMENFEESCEGCLFVLKNIESEERRNKRFFDEAIDQTKKDILTAVVGLDYFHSDAEFSDGIPVLEKKWKETSEREIRKCLMNAAQQKNDANTDNGMEDKHHKKSRKISANLSATSDSESSQSENESGTNDD